MLDLKWIRENPDALDAALARRKAEPLSAKVVALDEKHRQLQTALQTAQARRNEAAKEIGKVKASGGDADAIIKEVSDLKASVQEMEGQERELSAELEELRRRVREKAAETAAATKAAKAARVLKCDVCCR